MQLEIRVRHCAYGMKICPSYFVQVESSNLTKIKGKKL